MAKAKMCGCKVTKTRRGTPALRCTEAVRWQFLSKKQAAALRKKHGNKTFCTSPVKARKRGKRR